MKIRFSPETSEKKRKAIRAAIKAANTPAALRRRGDAIRRAAAKRKADRLNGNASSHGVIRPDHNLVPLDHIPGERPPVIAYSDSPGGGSIKGKSKDERIELAKALVATVYKLVS